MSLQIQAPKKKNSNFPLTVSSMLSYPKCVLSTAPFYALTVDFQMYFVRNQTRQKIHKKHDKAKPRNPDILTDFDIRLKATIDGAWICDFSTWLLHISHRHCT